MHNVAVQLNQDNEHYSKKYKLIDYFFRATIKESSQWDEKHFHSATISEWEWKRRICAVLWARKAERLVDFLKKCLFLQQFLQFLSSYLNFILYILISSTKSASQPQLFSSIKSYVTFCFHSDEVFCFAFFRMDELHLC